EVSALRSGPNKVSDEQRFGTVSKAACLEILGLDLKASCLRS
ncbi:hypothetical protein HMPREF9104_02374, partial [Lentilactobacillus kisonensis F0435]